jgi:uncharacterized protein (TIGR03083 family)
MGAPSPWPTIHAERAAVAADLSELPAAAWTTPSLCNRWTVQQVLAHMTATAAMTPPRFFARLAGAGFRFQAMTAKDIDHWTGGSPQDTMDRFREHLDASTAPPGPVDSWLGETIVHSTDIRWPLNITHEFPTESLIRVADFYKRSNTLIGAKTRIAGLRMTATDTDWSTGSGPEVAGTMLSIVMAMTGRAAALNNLTGDGVSTLTSRMA